MSRCRHTGCLPQCGRFSTAFTAWAPHRRVDRLLRSGVHLMRRGQPFFPRKPAHVAYCNSSTRISAFRLLRSRWPTLRPHCFSVSRLCASLSLSAVDGNVIGRFEILAACPNSRLVRDRAPLCFVTYIVSVILGKYAGAHPQSHSRSDQRLPKRTPAAVAAALIKAEPSRLS